MFEGLWQSSSSLTLVTAGLAAVFGAIVMFSFLQKTSRSVKAIAFADSGEYKMVILIRNDINMGKGKAAAQCCHAVLETYKEATVRYPKMLERWENSGQPKITLKVESEQELNDLVKQAKNAGLSAQAIRDAGRTQLAAGTKTVAAIGPGPAKMIDLITGHLKLY